MSSSRCAPACPFEPVRPNRAEPVDAFYLRFKYEDPAMAARVTERLGTLYIDYNSRERGALAHGTNEFLDSQLNEAKARLEQADIKLQAFRERHSGKLPSQLMYNMQAIQSTQLQRQAVVESLARDRDRKLMLERLYNDALAEPAPVTLGTASAAANTPGALAAMSPRQQLEIAKTNLSILEVKLKEGHPDLRRVRTSGGRSREAGGGAARRRRCVRPSRCHARGTAASRAHQFHAGGDRESGSASGLQRVGRTPPR